MSPSPVIKFVRAVINNFPISGINAGPRRDSLYRREAGIYLTVVTLGASTRDKKHRKNILGENASLSAMLDYHPVSNFASTPTNELVTSKKFVIKKRKSTMTLFQKLKKKWIVLALKYKNFFYFTKKQSHSLFRKDVLEKKTFYLCNEKFLKKFYRRERKFFDFKVVIRKSLVKEFCINKELFARKKLKITFLYKIV